VEFLEQQKSLEESHTVTQYTGLIWERFREEHVGRGVGVQLWYLTKWFFLPAAIADNSLLGLTTGLLLWNS
jgi:hypothetical protein